jgi:5-methylthioadenosine/S-adenosylhomocysteine deaminase
VTPVAVHTAPRRIVLTTPTWRRHHLSVLTLLVAVMVGCAERPAPPGTPDSRRAVSLVVSAGTVVTVDGDSRILQPGALAIDGRDIVAIGTPEEIAAAYTSDERIEAPHGIVLPGLVNTHTHAAMVLYRGLADDLALMDWLQQYIFPAEASTVSPEFVRAGTALAVLEMIRSGTTTYADMYYFEEEVAAVTRAAGVRGVLGQTVIRFPVPDAATPEAGLLRAERFIEQFQDDELIVPAVAPHAMYTLEAGTLQAARDLASRHGVPLLIHLAETKTEYDDAWTAHRQTPTRYLDGLGLLGPHVVAAHGVWLDAPDIAALARTGAGVSHNPESNMKLASGVAPVVEMLEAGVTVGLGTDGAASNNDLDMFEAMRQAALLHKLTRNDPRALPAPTALVMATRGGAGLLGLGDRIGSLEVGKRADLIVVDTGAPHLTPMYDPMSHLVYAAKGTDVETTIVNGRVLMHDRQVRSMDAAQVLADARAWQDRVRAAVTPEQ